LHYRLLRAGFFEEAAGQSFNLASGREVKIFELANIINELTGKRQECG
jgi:hypothetical protein